MATYAFRLIALIAFCFAVETVYSQVPIPPRYDGFLFKNRISSNSVVIEAFFDPVCPDSRDSWWPLKQILQLYQEKVSFIFHPFPLPYHNNAFIASRSLHIANAINTSYAYSLLDHFFKHQQRFYNSFTLDVAPAQITQQVIDFAVEKLGNSTRVQFESGFRDSDTDTATRISFKYGCSRAVTGTPYFFINGMPFVSDETLDYSKWKTMIDSLLNGQIQSS
eukprot:TRINITY_DN1721_c0_g1_i2.p1 TRINITY_DN1721_c0_g1~~TRINITY_DN1721_c0_g1_i2.p1  ORF type:complete len:221 (-),score=7.39 TRINITY_DN1721_c0_g1_i2:230-892(-)